MGQQCCNNTEDLANPQKHEKSAPESRNTVEERQIKFSHKKQKKEEKELAVVKRNG